MGNTASSAVHGIAPPFIGISCENIGKNDLKCLVWVTGLVTSTIVWAKNEEKNKLWFILRENVSHRQSIVEGGDNLFIKFSIKDVEYIWSNPTNYWYILSVMFRHLVWMSILGIIRETWDTPALDVITMLLQNYISNCS